LAKQSGPVAATFVGGGITVIASSIAYLKPPVLYLGWTVGLFLCIVCPFGIFAWNQYQLRKSEDDIGDISDDQVDEILDNPPTLKDEKTTIEDSWVGRKRLVLKLKVRNSNDIVLGNMDAILQIVNLENNKTREKHFFVPDLAPKEVEEQTFKIGIGGWGLPKKYKLVFVLYRMGFEVARKHFTFRRGLFDFLQQFLESDSRK
jgi:hypothetical protein